MSSTMRPEYDHQEAGALSMDGSAESTIMAHITAVPVSLDQLVQQVPHLTWNQVFQAVDGLSRAGSIRLRRKHARYELSRP